MLRWKFLPDKDGNDMEFGINWADDLDFYRNKNLSTILELQLYPDFLNSQGDGINVRKVGGSKNRSFPSKRMKKKTILDMHLPTIFCFKFG